MLSRTLCAVVRTGDKNAASNVWLRNILNSNKRCLGTGNDISSVASPSSSSDHQNQKPVEAVDRVILQRELQFPHMFNPKITPVRQSWLETFDKPQPDKLSLISLHPSVFADFPRPDLIQRNVVWQNAIHKINYLHLKTRAEMNGSNKKPWPQKGTGRARHGSRRAPQWKNGGWCNGPRGPLTRYYLLPFFTRIRGLVSTLSAKFAQNDIKIIDQLNQFPSDESEVLSEFLYKREWGPSVLIIDKSDVFPRNISLAAHNLDHVNLMPVFGLNVHSMLKHETLVLTLAALNEIEEKILFHLNRSDLQEVIYKHESPQVIPKEYPQLEGVRWQASLHEKSW